MDLQLIFSQVIRCLLLDRSMYEELAATPEESPSAILIVLGASLLAGIGGLIWTFTAAIDADHGRFFIRSTLLGTGLQAIAFFIWLAITLALLQTVYQLQIDYGELLRVMGYAFAPMALQLFVFIPALDQPIGIIALAATFYLSTYAIQVTTDATPGQAFVASMAGFVVFCAILGILGHGTLDLAPGIFALDPNSLSVGLTFPVVPGAR